MKNVDIPAAKRTREEIDLDAARSRDAHRRGHGHHQKKAKKVAAPVEDEVGAKVRVVGEGRGGRGGGCIHVRMSCMVAVVWL